MERVKNRKTIRSVPKLRQKKEKKHMVKISMNVNISKVPKNPDMFEFTISTPTLRSQFRLPRVMVNKMRVLIEKVLITK